MLWFEISLIIWVHLDDKWNDCLTFELSWSIFFSTDPCLLGSGIRLGA